MSSYFSFSPDQLIAIQQSVQQALQTPKKREPSALAAWVTHCTKAHANEYEAFKASNPTKQGISLLFCSQWRKDHPEEYAAFEAAHNEKYSSAAPSAVASAAAGAGAPPVLAPSFTKQYALVEERKGNFEMVIMTKMAEGWELQGGVSFLPSGRYLQAMQRDTRKKNNSGAGGSSGGRRKLTRKSLR
jgi:hypothetical protein